MQKKPIPGIYNYCDRWCERCQLRSQCALCNDPISIMPRPKDFSGRSFLEFISRDVPEMRSRIENKARAHGINLCLSEIPDAWSRSTVHHTKGPDLLTIRSLTYDMRVFRWTATLDVMGEHINESNGYLLKVQESLAVITRYSPLIHIKLCRALSSIITTDEWAMANGLQKDSDGSAKVALIVLERSVRAWHELYDMLPSLEDDILTFLLTLDRLKKMTLEKFPNAMQFVRPGFDEPAK